MLASYLRQGREEDALTAELGLAATFSPDAAFRTYESARAPGGPDRPAGTAKPGSAQLGSGSEKAGLAGPAEQRLTEAVHQGRLGSDNEALGRAAVALGIVLQHHQRLDEARNALEEGLTALDPAHPDAIIGRSHLGAARDSHLGAAQDGLTCGCDSGYLSDSLATAFREFVLARLPADLLDRLDVSIADGEFQVKVALRRKPAEGEIDRLNEVFAAANADFRQQLS